MKVTCPACRAAVPAGRINVADNVAVCDACEEVFSLSSLVNPRDKSAAGFDLSRLPSGVWFEETPFGFTLGGTTRSWGAFFLVPFMCVWSGFSLGGIYGGQIASGQFSLGASLFGIPFVLGTLLFGSLALMTVCGKITVSVERNEGVIFTGVGPIGRRQRFDWSEVESVEETASKFRQNGTPSMMISLIGQARTNFGTMLSDERRFYFVQALAKMLTQRSR